MRELRRTFNFRINSEMNVSITIASFIDDADQAAREAHEDFDLVNAYINNYNAAGEEA